VQEAKLTTAGDRILCWSRFWFIEFEDSAKITHTIKALDSEEPTRVLADKIKRLLGYQAVSESPDVALLAWFNSPDRPAEIREQLIAAGLLEPPKEEEETERLLLDDMVSEFERHLSFEKERSSRYIAAQVSILNRIFRECGFRRWEDIDATSIRSYLLSLRSGDKPVCKRTHNGLVQTVGQFCTWAVDNEDYEQIEHSPVARLRRLDKQQTDRRRIRRVLTPDECRRLLETTMQSPEVVEGMDGHERALLWRFMLETGLRRIEVQTLILSDLCLDDPKQPFVRVRAVNSKNRTEARIPIRGPLAAALKTFVQQRQDRATVIVFGGAFSRLSHHAVKALKFDLKAAGIAYADSTGAVIDLHSLRHTFVTRLGKSGVDIDTVKRLARHASIATTARYMHTDEEAKRQGIERLPDYDSPSSQTPPKTRTGTDDATA
jgi:site-specific recombinase XerD